MAITGTRREMRSKSSSDSAMPARRAMAITWMMALVEPPMAMCTAMAFWNAAGVRMSSGFRSSHTISTMRRPAWAHMRGWPESAAGSDEAPGRDNPSASAMAIIVAAVPMVMQVPNERATPFSISWGDAGEVFRLGLAIYLARLPSRCEVFFVFADMPHGKYTNEKVKQLLGLRFRDDLSVLWRKKV